MAKYNGCTPKQIEALMPLEAEAKDIKRQMKIRERRLAFDFALGFGEPIKLHDELDELQHQYEVVERKITKIYRAKDDMTHCLTQAKKYMAMAEAIKRHWDIP